MKRWFEQYTGAECSAETQYVHLDVADLLPSDVRVQFEALLETQPARQRMAMLSNLHPVAR
jgi:hypothetical protein